MKKYPRIFIVVLSILPLTASAQLTGVKSLITAVGGLINPLIAILTGLALLAFLWGLVRFIFSVGGDEKAVEEGKRIMKWGIIALFVFVSVWGIISFIQVQLLPGGVGGSGGGGGGGGGGSNPPSQTPANPFDPSNNLPA